MSTRGFACSSREISSDPAAPAGLIAEPAYHVTAAAERANALVPSGASDAQVVGIGDSNERLSKPLEAEMMALHVGEDIVECREEERPRSDVFPEEEFFFNFLKWQSTFEATDLALREIMGSLIPETFRQFLQSLLGVEQQLDNLMKIPNMHSVSERLSEAAKFEKNQIDCCVDLLHGILWGMGEQY